MTAESSRKPSTEPERTPVENARLLLPQLTPGQRAVVGALIAECERVRAERDARNGTIAELRALSEFTIEVGADEDDRCPRCHRLDMEADCYGFDPLDAELDRIVAARAKPDASDDGSLLHDRIHPTSGRLLHASPIHAPDDPHGLGEGWRRRTGGSWEQAWEHETGAMIGHLKGAQYWHYFYPRQPRSTGDRTDNGAADTAREAAALALGKPTVAREIDWIDWDAVRDAAETDAPSERYGVLTHACELMLRAYHAELVRTGAIAGKDGGK